MKKLDSEGFHLVEMLLAIFMFAIMAQMMAVAMLVLARATLTHESRNFGQQKAQQMYAELQSMAYNNRGGSGEVLDSFNDGSQYNFVLTTDKSVTQPDAPLSGNTMVGGHWRYLRQIQVGPSPNTDPNSRQVVVQVWKSQSAGASLVPGVLLDNTFGIISPGSGLPFSQ